MVLIDVQVSAERATFLRREIFAKLGPHAECLVSTPNQPGFTSFDQRIDGVHNSRITSLIRPNSVWWMKRLSKRRGGGFITPKVSMLQGSCRKSIVILSRLTPLLGSVAGCIIVSNTTYKITGFKETHFDYARNTIQHWAQRHMFKPAGIHSICGGDFNSVRDTDENGGGGFCTPLHDWAPGVG